MGIQRFKLSVANTVINYENSSISNVKDAGLVSLMKNLAESYQKEVKDTQEDQLPKSIMKKLGDAGMQNTWGDDEYDDIL